MNKYLVLLKQQGYGCDYTIGCGMNFYVKEGNSTNEVLDSVLWPDGKDEYSAIDNDDNALEEIHIIPFEYVDSFDLDTLKIMTKATRKKLENQRIERKLRDLEIQAENLRKQLGATDE